MGVERREECGAHPHTNHLPQRVETRPFIILKEPRPERFAKAFHLIEIMVARAQCQNIKSAERIHGDRVFRRQWMVDRQGQIERLTE